MRERQHLRRRVSAAVVLSTAVLVCAHSAGQVAAQPVLNPFRTGKTLIIPHSGGDGCEGFVPQDRRLHGAG